MTNKLAPTPTPLAAPMSAAHDLPDDAESEDIELLVIHEAARLLGHATTPEVAINGILRLMSQMVGLNRGRVVLPDGAGQMGIQYAYGLTALERQRGQYAPGEGVTGRVMRTGQTAVIQNIDDEPIYLTRAVDRASLPQETVSFLAVPILHDNMPMGVLAAHRLRKRKRAFSRDITLLRILATFIAQILRLNTLIEEKTARLADENRALKQALEDHTEGAHGILGDSPALKQALRQALHVAPTVATVLLTGESGTGKERFARMVHLTSQRCDGPFMAINCAAIPANLLESELFGHEKGSFTGAVTTKKGVVELSNGGTLFLDEIGDLAFDLQSKLLHVLEKQLIKRVGGTKDIPVDVRIIAATHKNLQKAVNEGRFRIDLFYRLNVFPIHLPPLRERSGDVRSLARHFLQAANQEFDRNTMFGSGVLERLEHYNWPGNIRQLENVVKRAVLVTQDGQIKLEDIILILRHEANIGEHLEAGMALSPSGGGIALAAPPMPAQPEMRETTRPAPLQPVNLRGYNWVREDEAQELLDALKQARGNKTRAAMALGMTARQLRYRMEKLGLMDGGESEASNGKA